eukprot:6210870-Pleurochrysis_carterae.AAC.5
MHGGGILASFCCKEEHGGVRVSCLKRASAGIGDGRRRVNGEEKSKCTDMNVDRGVIAKASDRVQDEAKLSGHGTPLTKLAFHTAQSFEWISSTV